MYASVVNKRKWVPTFSIHSSKKAMLASLSDTNDRSEIKLMNVWVLIICWKNFRLALSRLLKNPAQRLPNKCKTWVIHQCLRIPAFEIWWKFYKPCFIFFFKFNKNIRPSFHSTVHHTCNVQHITEMHSILLSIEFFLLWIYEFFLLRITYLVDRRERRGQWWTLSGPWWWVSGSSCSPSGDRP